MREKSELSTAEFPVPRLDVDEPKRVSSRVRVDVAAMSDKGRVREHNEDHYYVARSGRQIETVSTNIPAGDVPIRFDEAGYILIVADGMGGARGGEVASRLAIATLVNIVLNVPDWIQRLDEEHAHELMDRAASYYRRVNVALLERARVDPSLRGMGTTMTAAYSVGDDLFVANVGDSRAYLFRDGKLQLLTRDQTQAQMLADAGVIEQSEVARHRLRHVLTNALGGSASSDVRVDIQRLKLADGDRLLMCTDGLTDMVEDSAIAEGLTRHPDSEGACQALLAGALEAGGKDNVTVVVAGYRIPQEDGDEA